MSIKITASVERVFRLRSCSENDTICLLRASVSSGACRLAEKWGGFYLVYFPRITAVLAYRHGVVDCFIGMYIDSTETVTFEK